LLDPSVRILQSSGFNAVLEGKSGLLGLTRLAAENNETRTAIADAQNMWDRLSTVAELAEGWKEWVRRTSELANRLRQDLTAGVPETTIMAEMRRSTRGILLEADRIAPGFRDALWTATATGTRTGLLTAWKLGLCCHPMCGTRDGHEDRAAYLVAFAG
jgi:hypothetical protein